MTPDNKYACLQLPKAHPPSMNVIVNTPAIIKPHTTLAIPIIMGASFHVLLFSIFNR